ncbi:MAG: hypothetical protein JXJ20_07110 [Anaerolineae bacterium]|jgi:sugar lactone lactonase YvrE|nr:hypothetical protein [Anaerolineae bacterium]
MSTAARVRCAPGIVWVKDTGRALLVDGETGRLWALQDADALTWELLSMGYKYTDLVRMLALLLTLSEDETSAVLDDTLARWQAAGIVLAAGDSAHG